MIKRVRNISSQNVFKTTFLQVLSGLCCLCLVFLHIGCTGIPKDNQECASVRRIVVEKYVDGSVYKYEKVGEFEGDSQAAKSIMLAMERSSPEIVVFSTRYVLVMFYPDQVEPVRYAVGDRAFSSQGLGVRVSEENIEELVETLLLESNCSPATNDPQ